MVDLFYWWDLRIPLQVSHFCKTQPDVSTKALSSLKFPHSCQRWRLNWVSGGKSRSATGVCIGWITIGRRHVWANQRRGRCRQRRLLSRPANRGKTDREARPARHPWNPRRWALTWRGKLQISQANGQWSRPKTLRNFWKCWVSNVTRDYLSDSPSFRENYKNMFLFSKMNAYYWSGGWHE